MLREDSFCPVTGREDISLHGRRAEPDSLVAAHIISQSFSEGIKGIFEGTDQKVVPFPKTVLHHEPH